MVSKCIVFIFSLRLTHLASLTLNLNATLYLLYETTNTQIPFCLLFQADGEEEEGEAEAASRVKAQLILPPTRER